MEIVVISDQPTMIVVTNVQTMVVEINDQMIAIAEIGILVVVTIAPLTIFAIVIQGTRMENVQEAIIISRMINVIILDMIRMIPTVKINNMTKDMITTVKINNHKTIKTLVIITMIAMNNKIMRIRMQYRIAISRIMMTHLLTVITLNGMILYLVFDLQKQTLTFLMQMNTRNKLRTRK